MALKALFSVTYYNSGEAIYTKGQSYPITPETDLHKGWGNCEYVDDGVAESEYAPDVSSPAPAQAELIVDAVLSSTPAEESTAPAETTAANGDPVVDPVDPVVDATEVVTATKKGK